MFLEQIHTTFAAPKEGRVVVVGDVHGCRQELEALLAGAALTAADQLIFVGDLINTGPDSAGVVQLAREHRALAVLGNHELRLLRAREERDTSKLKKADYPTIRSLLPQDWDYLASIPLTLQIPEWNTVIVHGGFLPDQPWREQSADVVTRVQVLDRNGRPAKRSDCPDGTPWAKHWSGPIFAIYGHTPMRQVARFSHAMGIDTGCVYGGFLTAVILPERRFIQVPARRKYSA